MSVDSLYPEAAAAARADEEEALREEVMAALGWQGKYALPGGEGETQNQPEVRGQAIRIG